MGLGASFFVLCRRTRKDEGARTMAGTKVAVEDGAPERSGDVMPKHNKEDVDGRIEQVGSRRARGESVPEIARRFNVSERQIRYDSQEYLRRRRADRGGNNLQREQILAQYEEVLRAAWRDYERLGKGATSVDPKFARARAEYLRLIASVIDRTAALSGSAQEAQRAVPVSSPSSNGHRTASWNGGDLDDCNTSASLGDDDHEVEEMERLIGHDNFRPPLPESAVADGIDDEEVDYTT